MFTVATLLKLENNKYFVCSSDNLKENMNGTGCEFTRINKFISTEKWSIDIDSKKIDGYVQVLMKKYGIDNVRCGKYSNTILNDNEINEIIHVHKGIVSYSNIY